MARTILYGWITFAIAITAIGLFVWAWANFKKGAKTLRWNKVEGEVMSSHTEQTGISAEFNHPTYTLSANVKYIVDGHTYHTSNVDDFVGELESVGDPGPVAKKSKVSVYYNPENPREAVIDRAALRWAIILALLGVAFIALEWHWVAKTYF